MIKRDEFATKMLEYQLLLIGKTVQEALDNKKWIFEWDIDEINHKKFKDYFIKEALKTYKIPKRKVINNILNPFLLQWGLNVKKS